LGAAENKYEIKDATDITKKKELLQLIPKRYLIVILKSSMAHEIYTNRS